MKTYFFDFTKVKTTYENELIDFFYKKTHAEQLTFIWVTDSPHILKMKDDTGKFLCNFNNEFNIDVLFGRPVFYDGRIKDNILEFRAYR